MNNLSITLIVKPTIKPAFVLEPQVIPAGTVTPITISHFGGRPYAELGENWPICPDCELPLTFICQVNLNEVAPNLFPGIGLFTFFFCWDCFPNGDEGETEDLWVVKFYPHPESSRAMRLKATPRNQEPVKPCSFISKSVLTAPDWEGMFVWCPEAVDEANKINSDEPWVAYDQALEELGCFNEIATQVGGYPHWLQAEDTPRCPQSDAPLVLMAQIDSERKAGVTWGDGGSAYLFICPEHPGEVRLRVQSC